MSTAVVAITGRKSQNAERLGFSHVISGGKGQPSCRAQAALTSLDR